MKSINDLMVYQLIWLMFFIENEKKIYKYKNLTQYSKNVALIKVKRIAHSPDLIGSVDSGRDLF